jgi:hypothetical protein
MDAIGNYAQGISSAVQQATQRRQVSSKNNADRQQPTEQTQNTKQAETHQTVAPQRQPGRAEQVAGQLTQQLATERANHATQTVGNAQPQGQNNGTVTPQRKQQALAQYQAQAQEQAKPQRQQQAQTQQTQQSGSVSVRA